MSKPIEEFELIDHGIENSQYFQGCGTSFTEFTDIATGCGNNASEAVNDALESLAQHGWDCEGMEQKIIAQLPGKNRIPTKPSVPASWEDSYYYVSIRVR